MREQTLPCPGYPTSRPTWTCMYVRGGRDLKQADMLPKDMRASIEKQILAVAATVK
jgi:hypothetical protein